MSIRLVILYSSAGIQHGVDGALTPTGALLIPYLFIYLKRHTYSFIVAYLRIPTCGLARPSALTE